MDNKAYLAARNLRNGAYTVYAEYSHDRKVKRMPTGVVVPMDRWDNTARSITGAGATAANNKAIRVLHTLREQVRELYLANGNVHPTVDQLTKRQKQRTEALREEAKELPLVKVLEAWMVTKQDWAPSTRRNFQTVLHNIVDYERAHRTTWYLSTLQTEDITTWQGWLKATKPGKEQMGYADSTLHKRVRLLRQFLQRHVAPHVDLEADPAKAIHAVMLTIPFVLSLADIDAIEALPLPHMSRLDKVRDLLLLQTFTGLRWSDLSRLKSRFISGGYINMTMRKSAAKATRVHIPIFDPVRQVLTKYTTQGMLALPKYTDQKFNLYLKELCAMVPALQEDYTQDYRLRGTPMERTKEKWEFVTSHTLRRTFVSTCLDLGYTAKQVMAWSGHSSWASFQRYVGATQQSADAAEEFSRRRNQSRLGGEAASTEYTAGMQPESKLAESRREMPVQF